MSDGDDATPGRHPRGQPSDDGHRFTRSPQPLPGAAPWERGRRHDDHPTAEPDAHTPGSNGAITVADLIAKVSGEPHDERPPEPTRHHRVSDPPASPASPPPAPPPVRVRIAPARTKTVDHEPSTEVIPVVPAHASELPLLSAERRAPAHPARIGHGPERPRSNSQRNVRAARVVGRVAAALIAVLALAMTGAAWQWQASKDRSLNKVAALDPNSRDIVDPNAQFGDENFLIVGVDSRIGVNSDMGAGGTDDAGGSRSDTIMLVNIPASRKRVVAVSFPRDTAITPSKCEAWNPDTGEYGPLYDEQTKTYGEDQVYTETKLNSAYSLGGPKCLVKVIQKLSGLSINRFMAVDFAGFSKMVDALGGVEVCSTTPLEDYELGTVLANAGRQTLDGHAALQYVRARQVTTEFNGDYGRIKRQQLFLSSLLRSMMSQEVFFDLGKLNNVVNMFIDDTYVDNVKTKDLVDLGQSIQGLKAGRVTFVTIPTGITDTEGNEPPRVDDMKGLFDAIINDDPLPEEKNPDNTPVPATPEATTATAPPADPSGELVNAVTTDPGGVTVRVSNSTGEDGLAATASSELGQHGFNVVEPDDYSGAVDATTVMFSAGNEEAAATVASSFINPKIERVADTGATVRVVLGSDFHAVNPPSPSGSTVQVHVVKGTSSEPTHLPEDLTVTNAADTTCE
jgi:LCP family protein required for cell wall assembly